jgi:hypothetical protein
MKRIILIVMAVTLSGVLLTDTPAIGLSKVFGNGTIWQLEELTDNLLQSNAQQVGDLNNGNGLSEGPSVVIVVIGADDGLPIQSEMPYTLSGGMLQTAEEVRQP